MPKPNKPRAREWTRDDVRRMRQYARQRFSAKECAAAIGRTRGAVAYKAMMLGVHFRAIEQPAGVQQRIVRARRRRARR